MKPKNTKLWVALIVIGIIAIGGLYTALNKTGVLGADGDIVTIAVRFAKGFKVGTVQPNGQWNIDNRGQVTQGGSVLATTSSGTVTETAVNIQQNHTIAVTPAIGTVTYTLPTKTNLNALNPLFIPNSSDTATKYFVNASTTSSGTVGIVRIVGNTGVIVRNVSTTTAQDFLYAGDEARLDFRRSATSTDIYVDVSIFHK